VDDHATQRAQQRLDTLEVLVDGLARQQESRSKATSKVVMRRCLSPKYCMRSSLHARCISLSDYLKAALPLPATARLIITIGQSPYNWVWPNTQSCPIAQMLADKGAGALSLIPALIQPAILARKLMELALSLLQPAFRFAKTKETALQGLVPHVMARTLLEAVQNVTSQDVLIRSIDGLETLFLEGLYQVYSGNIDLSGQLFRRTLAIAKSMGIQRLYPTTDDRINRLWFRIVYTDRWHALATGRPSAVFESGIFIPTTDEDMRDKRRLDQWHLVIAGRIIERNMNVKSYPRGQMERPEDLLDHRLYGSIDRDLKTASISVSIDFWTTPSQLVTNDEDAKEDTARIMTQCHQYYLILLTHQPSVLLSLHHNISLVERAPSVGTSDSYSSASSASAAREVLLRIPHFLRYPHLTSSMKGLRHKAYQATTILLLLHIHNACTGNEGSIGHHSHDDLNLLRQTMLLLDDADEDHEESTGTSYSATNLDRLVSAVQKAYVGTRYAIYCDWCASLLDESDPGPQLCTVTITFPYFGEVRVFLLHELEFTTAET
jgi:hypothetical protein